MTYLLMHIGDMIEGCAECSMDQQSQRCKAGFLRKPMSVMKRGQVRYHRSSDCRKNVFPEDCRTCLFRKVLLSNNWCKWFRLKEEAEKGCIWLGRKYWRPFTVGSIQQDDLDEFERLEDLE
jgi:hypothetical protein